MIWRPREKKGINITNKTIYIYAPHKQTRFCATGRVYDLGWLTQTSCVFYDKGFFVDCPDPEKLK